MPNARSPTAGCCCRWAWKRRRRSATSSGTRFFFDRGVRYITSPTAPTTASPIRPYALEKWNGLSPSGREVVREMNRLGIMVDVSHLGVASAREAIAEHRCRVIASHSAFRHFTPDFRRNISDELARAIAAKGGVVQVPFGTAFIDPPAPPIPRRSSARATISTAATRN